MAIALSALLARVVHPFGDAGLRVEGMSRRLSPALGGAREILEAKCADCHSSNIKAPAYAKLAPVAWLVERDLMEGRKAMNLSLWDRYSPERQQTLAAKMVQKAKSHEMPLPQYRLIHWNSAMTDAELQTLQVWARQSPANDAPQAIHDGDAAIGRRVFEKRCTGCHSLTENREGPQLGGVYGRPSSSIRGFAYSAAISNAHLVWNDANLERWLTDTDAAVPGNNMDFRVVKPQERKDVIAFFKASR